MGHIEGKFTRCKPFKYVNIRLSRRSPIGMHCSNLPEKPSFPQDDDNLLLAELILVTVRSFVGRVVYHTKGTSLAVV